MVDPDADVYNPVPSRISPNNYILANQTSLHCTLEDTYPESSGTPAAALRWPETIREQIRFVSQTNICPIPTMNDPDAERDAVATSEFDWSRVSPTTAIAESIADVEGADPADLDSLYAYVDPDALEALLFREAGTTDVAVRFTFGDYVVRLTSDGSLSLFE